MIAAACYHGSCVLLMRINKDGSLEHYEKKFGINFLHFGKDDTEFGPNKER